MAPPEDTRIELIKLVSGVRVIRVIDLESSACLERELDPQLPVVAQTREAVAALLGTGRLKETAGQISEP